MTMRISFLSLALAALASSCVINADSHTEYSGQYISPKTIAQIEEGHSSDYVLAILGEPTTRTEVGEQVEIWKWQYREKRTSSGAVFLLYSGSNKDERNKATYVELRDGVVVKAWQD